MTEIEDTVKEQDAALAALMDRVQAENADVTKQKQIVPSDAEQRIQGSGKLKMSKGLIPQYR